MGRKLTLKHTMAVLSCAVALAASLTACSGSDDTVTQPTNTGSSGQSTTTSALTTTAPAPTSSGPVALTEHATYDYDGLKVTVNLPANIPKAALPSMRVFSEFLQANGRTMARNKLDPSMSDLANAQVVKEAQDTVGPVSVQGIGSLIFTISKVDSAGSNYTLVTGCLDQSKVVQVRKDGSHFIDEGATKYPRLKMTADINRGMTGPKVTSFAFPAGTC